MKHTYNVELNRAEVIASVRDDRYIVVSRRFNAEGYFSMTVTPASTRRAFAKARKWAKEMCAVLDAESAPGTVDIPRETMPAPTVPRMTPEAMNRIGEVQARASVAQPMQTLATSAVVGALTGSAAAGAAVGILGGGDVVDAAIGGIIGDMAGD